MVLNVPLEDKVVEALNGERIRLQATEALQQAFLGRAAFQDVEAIICPTGIVFGMELEEDEARAIAQGQRHFLMHIYSTEGINPFRLIFERVDPGDTRDKSNGSGEEKDLFDLRLPDSTDQPKTD